jgi:hypothetical protein
MSTDIAAFDPAALKKRVAETVQVQFGMLIPEAQFTEMVNREIRAFFEDDHLNHVEVFNNSYNSQSVKVRCTPFRVMVWDRVHEILKKKLSDIIFGEQYVAQIGYNQEQRAQLSQEMEQVLERLVPKMMGEAMRTFFASMVTQAKHDIMNGIR